MHLKSLTLRGFKSFADKVNLKFERGITVIVGPNGSGKSNLTDAVLWVLGEQSPRSLRGASMEDVIFTGSSARQALGTAEVSLTLDNSDGSLPIEYSDVTVTRRLYRSGESDYSLNESPCRLLDIQELLSDSGLGRDAYSIISQGRLEETLNARPEERRALIEEAAGVLKHKKRKERALRRLRSMDQHLTRAKDILQEVNRQLRPLRAQAGQAEAYRELSREMQDLEIGEATLRLKKLQAEWDKVLAREGALSTEVDEHKEERARLEGEVERLQTELENRGVLAGDLGEQRRRITATRERLSTGLLLLEEKGKNLVQRASEMRQMISQLESRMRRVESEKAGLDQERQSVEARINEQYAAFGEARRRSETVKKKRLESDEALAALTARLHADEAALASARDRAHGLSVGSSEALSRVEMLEGASKDAKVRVKELRETQEKVTGQAAALDGDLERSRRELADEEENRERAGEKQGEVDDELRSVRQQLAKTEAQAAALSESMRSMPGSAEAIDEALGPDRKKVVGVLKDLIEVPPELEKAVEAALGPDLFCVVVNKASTAGAIAARMAAGQGGAVSIAALEFFPAATGGPAADSLAASVRCRKGVAGLVDSLLGRVFRAETLADALDSRADGAGYVTARGELVVGRGKIVLRAGGEEYGLLGSKRRLAELEGRIGALERQVADLESRRTECEADLRAAGEAERKAAAALARLEAERGALDNRLASLKVEMANWIARGQQADKETAELGQRVHRAKEDAAESQREIKRLEKSVVKARQELPAVTAARDEALAAESHASAEITQCRLEMDAAAVSQGQLKTREMRLSAELEELVAQLATERGLVVQLETMRARIQPVHVLYSGLMEGARLSVARLEEQYAGEAASSQGLRDSLHESQERLRSLAERLEEVTGRLRDVELKKAQLELQVTGAVQRIVDDLDVPLEKALERPTELTADEYRQRIGQVKSKIGRLGPVNPIAMKELDELEERQRFLTEEIDDLLNSKDALDRIVKAVDRKIRQRFQAAFDDVNNHFQKVFAQLFPGGYAELVLTDPDNLEETGIDIEAQPSGKKVQRLTLLSGGERALVSVALLFAVYHTRPSPFYVLDEVEAALDDINLQRFIQMIRDLSSDTQFLIITHQRRTMEIADCLYGVSMQAEGVSRLISQKMSELVAS